MTTTTTNVTDLYPTRGATEVATPRQDPVVWGSPDTPGPVSAGDLQALDRDGFLAIDQLIAPDEVAEYQRELERAHHRPGHPRGRALDRGAAVQGDPVGLRGAQDQ
ncbi:hypothetical protein SVIOM342S_02184 [Streptomyces violaceorubidus]